MAKKSGLGKGLSALIPSTTEVTNPEDHYEEIPIAKLRPNPEQPRHHFHETALQELSNSIKHNGVIQPIIVTPAEDGYVVIAGERRWRATKLAGYEKIPAVVRRVEAGQMLSLALLENIQRQELNPIEEALAYNRLLDQNNFTHETLATRMGKSRVTITNTIRLLKLPDPIKAKIQDNKLSFGHARCLITIEDGDQMMQLAESCIHKQWSVRELERRIQQMRADKKEKPKKGQLLKDTEQRLAQALGQKVAIAGDGKKGKISIAYTSAADFESLVERFLR